MNRFRTAVRSGRGNALVLAALILLSVTAVGVVSVQHTNTDLMAAGNLAQASKAGMAAEVGMSQSQALLGRYATCYTAIIDDIKKKMFKGLTGYTAVDCSGEDQKATKNLSILMVERSSAETVARYRLSNLGNQPLARRQQDIAYDGEIFWIGEINGMPGFQVEGSSSSGGSSLCFQVYDVMARGGVPSIGEKVSETLCPRSTGRECFSNDDCEPGSTCQDDHCYCLAPRVVVHGQGRVVAGPTPCYLK